MNKYIIGEIIDEILIAEDRFSKALADIDQLFRRLKNRIQNLCEHTDKTYLPDPSGNNDSEWKCNICGKTAKKL